MRMKKNYMKLVKEEEGRQFSFGSVKEVKL